MFSALSFIPSQTAAHIVQIMTARVHLAESLSRDSPLFQSYLSHLLEAIISKGDMHQTENSHQADVELAAKEICQLLRPWSILARARSQGNRGAEEDDVDKLQREAWFNLIVHGITPGSKLYQAHLSELRTLAIHLKPLIAKDRASQSESDIELNTVLRRGMSGPHTAEMKKLLIKFLNTQESNIKALSYPRVVFLSAAYMMETLRAEGGNCAEILSYFLDPSINRNELGGCMEAVADHVMAIYLRRTLSGRYADSSAPYVAKQLATILTGCCHRISRVQRIAATCADKLINQMPSCLCQRSSLFALLELLTLMWSSCLEAEIDEYEWKSNYVSVLGKVTLELSDDYDFRRKTLEQFYQRSKNWIMLVINIAPLDVKGLLQVRRLIASRHDCY